MLNIWNGTSWTSAKGASIWNGTSWIPFLNLDSITMSVGHLSGAGVDFYGYTQNSWGSITPTTTKLYPGNPAIASLFWTSGFSMLFQIADNTIPNSGWNTITINGTTFNRTDATFHTGVSGGNYWTWANIGTNPFGTSGNIQITWN